MNEHSFMPRLRAVDAGALPPSQRPLRRTGRRGGPRLRAVDAGALPPSRRPLRATGRRVRPPGGTAGRPPGSPARDKGDLILRAAIDTFAARGFFNAQVADVARAAGVAAGTVYLYFRGKDDLLVSIFERTMADAVAEGREAVGRETEPVERLRAIARVHLDRLGRDRALAVVFQIELRQSTKFMERFSSTWLREYLGIIRDIIANGQARRVFRREINPTLGAKVFFGALDEMATNWILSRRKYSLASDTDAIVDLFVGGLRDARRGT